MSKLASFFPEHERKDFITRELVPGRVLYLSCDFTDPPKDKLLVLVALAPLPLLFIVNSSIHPFISARPYLASCQVKLEASSHSFLVRDSYLDCSNVISTFSVEELISQLAADTSRIKTLISASAKASILAAIQPAPTISSAHKKLIRASLK